MTSHERILLSHGGGGVLTQKLIEEIILKHFHNPALTRLEDQATLEFGNGKLAFTTDSFVVSPLFFPGGDIGELAIYGTVNDLAVGGAKPLYLSFALIVEEGFSFAEFERVIKSAAAACVRAGVSIVCGDTKVVERGRGDGLYINTSGVGLVPNGLELSSANLQEGDKIILSGTLAEHGFAILAVRKGIEFASSIKSDCAPVVGLCRLALEEGKGGVRAMRDPTRGGLAALLNEWAKASGAVLEIDEEAIPLSDGVRAASEMLGIDWINVACEGRVAIAVSSEKASAVLEALQKTEEGSKAAIIGDVTAKGGAKVVLKAASGGRRLIHTPTGEQLPRIC